MSTCLLKAFHHSLCISDDRFVTAFTTCIFLQRCSLNVEINCVFCLKLSFLFVGGVHDYNRSYFCQHQLSQSIRAENKPPLKRNLTPSLRPLSISTRPPLPTLYYIVYHSHNIVQPKCYSCYTSHCLKGVILKVKCIFQKKALPLSGPCLLLKMGGGGLTFGRIRYFETSTLCVVNYCLLQGCILDKSGAARGILL